jgi:hypothetical protein
MYNSTLELLSSASFRSESNGIVVYVNPGFADPGQGDNEKNVFFRLKILTKNHMKCYYLTILLFHYSIIHDWNKQNSWSGISCYRQGVEFLLYFNIKE